MIEKICPEHGPYSARLENCPLCSTKVCKSHGPYDVSLNACPYCSSGVKDNVPFPPIFREKSRKTSPCLHLRIIPTFKFVHEPLISELQQIPFVGREVACPHLLVHFLC
jgi:hypothetical protein